ncbi:Peroxisomal biogenesis factor 3 [Trichoplax sp. H2]|nr:Peroxisomal biogenesis factor 3 [Trichoplax sp. H2]|eukprot:RDD46216.1 Peroxisomal biogenesis factor 3 [Trichoplax sp. H2]
MTFMNAMYNFFNRHRRKIIISSAIAGGVVVLVKYSQWRLQKYIEGETTLQMTRARMENHFNNNQKTCHLTSKTNSSIHTLISILTIISLLPNLSEAIEKEINLDELTEKLKARPPNRLQIWENLKTLTFTQVVTKLYSVCMLTILVRIQLNIIGGYMYLDSTNDKETKNADSDQTYASARLQQRYLSVVYYLLGDGMKEFIKVVKDTISDIVTNLSLKKEVSLGDISQLFQRIRMVLHDKLCQANQDSKSFLTSFMIPPNDEISDSFESLQENQLFSKLMSETRDMIESQDCIKVMNHCLDFGFNTFMDKVDEAVKQQVTSKNIEITLAVAKLLPVVTSQLKVMMKESSNTSNSFLQKLMDHKLIEMLSLNIYEAFAQPI